MRFHYKIGGSWGSGIFKNADDATAKLTKNQNIELIQFRSETVWEKGGGNEQAERHSTHGQSKNVGASKVQT